MLVGELKERLGFLVVKIVNLEAFIKNNELETYNDALKELFGLYDDRRSYNILLRRTANLTIISLGKNRVSVSDAKALLNTIKDKIGIMTDIIENIPPKLDIIQLMEERDRLTDECIMLVSSIEKSNWSTEVD